MSELFDIIVDYPDSMSALLDIKVPPQILLTFSPLSPCHLRNVWGKWTNA